MVSKIEMALALAFGGLALLGIISTTLGYAALVAAAMLSIHIAFEYGQTRERKRIESWMQKAERDKLPVPEIPFDWLSSGSKNRRLAQAGTALREMQLWHGHLDDQGIMEAVRTGKSFNAEPCWICGKPRFQKHEEGMK